MDLAPAMLLPSTPWRRGSQDVFLTPLDFDVIPGNADPVLTVVSDPSKLGYAETKSEDPFTRKRSIMFFTCLASVVSVGRR